MVSIFLSYSQQEHEWVHFTNYQTTSLNEATKCIQHDFLSLCSECAHLFHKGGARLILCGTSWDKLESLYDSLTNNADPREVRELNKRTLHKAVFQFETS